MIEVSGGVLTSDDRIHRTTATSEVGSPPAETAAVGASMRVVILLAFILPVLAYLWFIAAYGVNVIWGDQWTNVPTIGHSYDGTLRWGTLWTMYHGNRMLFPNLLVIVLARTTHLNLFVEMYLGAFMLIGASALFVVAHKRRSPTTPWLYYCPIPILLFSFVQFENTLWGFQIAWYMVLLCLAASLFMLDSVELGSAKLLGAVAAATVGSFSLEHGLLIWPAGLVLLYQRRRSLRVTAAWIGAAIITAVLFYYHGTGPSTTTAFHLSMKNPINIIRFFFVEIGDVVGQTIPSGSQTGNTAVMLFGAVLCAVALGVIFAYGVKRDTATASPIGVSLVVYGLLFAGSVAVGRTFVGVWEAASSRYTTDALLVLVGTYCALLGRVRMVSPIEKRRSIRPAMSLVIAAMCLQVALGTYNGLAGAQASYALQVSTEHIVANIGGMPGGVLFRIFPFFRAGYLVRQVDEAKRLHLSLFGTGASDVLSREGVVLGPWSIQAPSPVHPSEDVRNGQTIRIDLSLIGRRHMLIQECNASVLRGDTYACGPAVTRNAANWHRYVTIRVVEGAVGDGTCLHKATCYVRVLAGAGRSRSLSLAAVRFA